MSYHYWKNHGKPGQEKLREPEHSLPRRKPSVPWPLVMLRLYKDIY
jgi:hypothetical protein